jgi:hypothetical protein
MNLALYLFKTKRLLGYYFSAKNIYNVHSPFVYQFMKEVMDDKRGYYAFGEARKIKSILQFDHTDVELNNTSSGTKDLTSTKYLVLQKLVRQQTQNFSFYSVFVICTSQHQF